MPGWVQSWTVIFDKHHILDQIKRNLEIVATIFLHTNTFTQHALPKIFQEVGIFTAEKMGIIQENYKMITERLQVSYAPHRKYMASRPSQLREPSIYQCRLIFSNLMAFRPTSTS